MRLIIFVVVPFAIGFILGCFFIAAGIYAGRSGTLYLDEVNNRYACTFRKPISEIHKKTTLMRIERRDPNDAIRDKNSSLSDANYI